MSLDKENLFEIIQYGAALLLPGLSEHIVGFVVGSLPFSRSVSSSMGRIHLNHIIRD